MTRLLDILDDYLRLK